MHPVNYKVNEEYRARFLEWLGHGKPDDDVFDWCWETIAQLNTTICLQKSMIEKLLDESKKERV